MDLDEYAFATFLLHRLPARPRHLIFDVGAAAGKYTRTLRELWAGIPAQYHLFEPRPGALADYVHDPDVVINEYALSNAEGVRDNFVLAPNPEHSHLRASLPGRDILLPVWTSTVDQYLGTNSCTLLKIDTEGWEWPILEGAGQALTDGRIFAIQFEYGDCWRGSYALAEMYIKLRNYGMQVFEWAAAANMVVAYDEPIEDYTLRNILAVRSDAMF